MLYQWVLGSMQVLISSLSYFPFMNWYLVLSPRGLSPTLSQLTVPFCHLFSAPCRVHLLLAMSPWSVATCTHLPVFHVHKWHIRHVTHIFLELVIRFRKETKKREKGIKNYVLGILKSWERILGMGTSSPHKTIWNRETIRHNKHNMTCFINNK